MVELSDSKRRLLDRLKRVESATAPELAAEFDITDTAARQHLEALETHGLVERFAAPHPGRGRPPVRWRLTAPASEHFPDRHGELSVEFVTAIRQALGDEGVDRVVTVRADRQIAAYRAAVPTDAPITERVRRLAELRTGEGYLAEVIENEGSVTLVEHHCPICEAARVCPELCRSELALFRAALGSDVSVERTSHLLGSGTRCAYRIQPTT